ncbi:Protein CBG03370 [Caenorhabditis briggsae]|uniref:Protein CBG03370 n=2 Tax=Caenorhabditis briggsae TaxID=6238 RepID=A8WUW0_CAEBR|nr:Protein CBG03370 [Caenorhabditis briggsae]UMM29062.1 hypothetical protein L5515_011608 [Caenorhabditis briggsae]CAP24272.1 Protein CBG03370 [Caenorhabditis briggsae]
MLSIAFLLERIVLFGSSFLFLFPLINCSSKKKFETDGKADLVPKSVTPPVSSPVNDESSKQAPPTSQTPPARTPVEKTGSVQEDTLANVKSLPPEKSEAPDSKKKKKK